ncbi:hypothetical protein HII36_11585 [Nonomuraea sp. NN258]|uniref:hypothetical protein n=1 Tax=Nonomuraea antri TaxID=2730852 RepID=UPI001567F8A7|nr:hypothetical protein [Nonomuraea antri]NRQ32476.1 hypothetical protein [Nonomuraea antri]
MNTLQQTIRIDTGTTLVEWVGLEREYDHTGSGEAVGGGCGLLDGGFVRGVAAATCHGFTGGCGLADDATPGIGRRDTDLAGAARAVARRLGRRSAGKGLGGASARVCMSGVSASAGRCIHTGQAACECWWITSRSRSRRGASFAVQNGRSGNVELAPFSADGRKSRSVRSPRTTCTPFGDRVRPEVLVGASVVRPLALRFRERQGLIRGCCITGNQRSYHRTTPRAVAFIRGSRNDVAVPLLVVGEVLAVLAGGSSRRAADLTAWRDHPRPAGATPGSPAAPATACTLSDAD